MDMNIAIGKNKNFVKNMTRTLGSASSELLGSMSPTAAKIIKDNVKYIKLGIHNPEKHKQNTYEYKSSKELVNNSISSLMNDNTGDNEVEQAISTIQNFVIENDEMMDYVDDDVNLDHDVKNVSNNINVVLKTNMKTTLSIIYMVNNNIAKQQVDYLSKTHSYIIKLNRFNTDYSISYYNELANQLNSLENGVAKISNKMKQISEFQKNSFEVNNKFNQLRSAINSKIMFSKDYYANKMASDQPQNIQDIVEDVKEAEPLVQGIVQLCGFLVPQEIKEAFNQTEELLKVVPVVLNKKFEKMKNSQNHLTSFLGTAFHTDTEKDLYEKGSMNFDGITRRAIMNVIPSGLTKILNIVKSKKDPMDELVFDYEYDNFTSARAIYEQADKDYELNITRDGTPLSAFKHRIIDEMKNQDIYSSDSDREIDSAIRTITIKKTLPTSRTKFSRNDDINNIIHKTFRNLSPYEKSAFMEYIINETKTPEEIISENESFHNVLDVIGFEGIIDEKQMSFKDQLSHYLVGKNYNELDNLINQKLDIENNPFPTGSVKYYMLEGIKSFNTMISELMFGTPDGKVSEISKLTDKMIMFTGKSVDKAVDFYRVHIASDKRSKKVMEEIKGTGIVQATKDYLLMLGKEMKENGITKWFYDKLIVPISDFMKNNVYNKVVEGYENIVGNIKARVKKSKIDTVKSEEKRLIDRRIIWYNKVKKNILKVDEVINNVIINPLKNIQNSVKSGMESSVLSQDILERLESTAISNIEKQYKLERNIEEDEELIQQANRKPNAVIEAIKNVLNTGKIITKVITSPIWFPAKVITKGIRKTWQIVSSVVRNFTGGSKDAKNYRPEMQRKSISEQIGEMLQYGRDEKDKTNYRGIDIFKNGVSIAKNYAKMRFITPFKTISTAVIRSRKSIFNIIKNTTIVLSHFAVKVAIPVKLFGLYMDKMLGAHIFIEAKRFNMALKKSIIKESIATLKYAAQVNKEYKQTYKVNPEYAETGFVTKNFSIVGGYLDNIHQTVEVEEYMSGYGLSQMQLARQKADDRADIDKVLEITGKSKGNIAKRIGKRMEFLKDFIGSTISEKFKSVVSGIGTFTKGVTGGVIKSVFKGTKTEQVVTKMKDKLKGTTVDRESAIEHVWVVGGKLSGGGLSDAIDIASKGKKSGAGELVKDIVEDIATDTAGKAITKQVAKTGMKATLKSTLTSISNIKGVKLATTAVKNTKTVSSIMSAASAISTGGVTAASVGGLVSAIAWPLAAVWLTSRVFKGLGNVKNAGEIFGTEDPTLGMKTACGVGGILDAILPGDQSSWSKGIYHMFGGKKDNDYQTVANVVNESSNSKEQAMASTTLQANSSMLSSSLSDIQQISVGTNEVKNYTTSKEYEAKVEQEFISKLSADEKEEYMANKNANSLAARLRTNKNGIISTLLSTSSLGALALPVISFKMVKKLIDRFIKKSGIKRSTFEYLNADYNATNNANNQGVLDQGIAELGSGDMFGKISAKYETGSSGYTGAAMISSGAGDAGGVSYGIPQFSTTMGSAKGFANWLQTAYPQFGSLLAGKNPGTSAFNSAWKEAYNLNPRLFAQAQEVYAFKIFTWPFIEKAQNSLGVNFNGSRALQEAAHSLAIQFGQAGAYTVASRAGLSSNDNEVTIIKKLYQEKRNSVGTYKFNGCSASVRSGVLKRFTNEEKDVLSLAGQPAINLQSLLGGGVSNADKTLSTTNKIINKLNEAMENASVNVSNIRDIIKKIKSMQILNDDTEINQLVDIINLLGKLSNNTKELAKDDILLRYSENYSELTNKPIENMFTGGYQGKLA